MGMAGVVKPPVRQFSRYLNESALRRGIFDRFNSPVDGGTRVVIAHSSAASSPSSPRAATLPGGSPTPIRTTRRAGSR